MNKRYLGARLSKGSALQTTADRVTTANSINILEITTKYSV